MLEDNCQEGDSEEYRREDDRRIEQSLLDAALSAEHGAAAAEKARYAGATALQQYRDDQKYGNYDLDNLQYFHIIKYKLNVVKLFIHLLDKLG